MYEYYQWNYSYASYPAYSSFHFPTLCFLLPSLEKRGAEIFLLNILKCQCGHVIKNHWPNPWDAIVYRFPRIIYQRSWVWNLERIDRSLMKVPRFFSVFFSVPKKRGHRLFWNLSRPYYCILLKKTIQGNEPTLPPPQQKSLARPVICVLVEQQKPMGKSALFFYNSPKIYTMERDEENKNLFTDGPVRNPLSKTSRFNFSPLSGILLDPWEKSI